MFEGNDQGADISHAFLTHWHVFQPPDPAGLLAACTRNIAVPVCFCRKLAQGFSSLKI